MNILSKFLSKIQNGIYLGVGFMITVGLVGITYAAINQVTSGDILTAAKFNSLIDASYHTATAKKNTGDFFTFYSNMDYGSSLKYKY